MSRLTTGTRRELLGVFVGALVGAALTFYLWSSETLANPLLLIPLSTLCGVAIGALFRGKIGWMILGTAIGAIVASAFLGHKFGVGGMFPGAFVGLLATVIGDLSSTAEQSHNGIDDKRPEELAVKDRK